MRFVIDAGHGLNTAGKRCLKSLDPAETREWTLNQRIATKVVELLNAAGQETMRVDDTTGKIDVALAVEQTHGRLTRTSASTTIAASLADLAAARPCLYTHLPARNLKSYAPLYTTNISKLAVLRVTALLL